MKQTEFVYPENLRFECTRCGDCCRQWQVMLGPGERERLRSLDWSGREQDLVVLSPVAKADDRSVLARRDDGACIFLGAANQCRIHEHFGADEKPLMCRLFPFGFVAVGERVAVDVSYACRSVSEGSGSPLKLRTPEWAKLSEGVSHGGATQHRFSKKYSVPGALLWELEHELLQLLMNRNLSLLERVQAVSEFVRLAMTSDPRTDAARKLRQVMVTGVVDLVRARNEGPADSSEPVDASEPIGPMDKTQRAIFFHLLFVLLNPTPPELRNASGKSRQKEVRRRVQAADAYKFDNAFPWLDNRELGVSYKTIGEVDSRYVGDGGGAELVTRYLEAKIVGQRFVHERENDLPFLEAVPRLLLMYPMLVWTAKALAAEDQQRRVAEAHVRSGLRLLDRSFGSVRLADLPAKQRKAWQFVLLETDLPTCASHEMLARDAEGA